MFDYLDSMAADSDNTLRVSPSKVIVEEGSKTQTIHIGDDGSEERIALSDDSTFYCTLIWTYKSASDAGTVMDFYHDSAKGNGNAKTFIWENLSDGHFYVVRFDGKLKRQLINANGVIYSFPNVRLKVLGSGFHIDAADLSSATELTEPALDGVRLVDADDVTSLTEITAPTVMVAP